MKQMKQTTIEKFIDILIEYMTDVNYIVNHPSRVYEINDYIIMLRAYDNINQLHYGDEIYQIYYDTCDILSFDIICMLTGECFKINL